MRSVMMDGLRWAFKSEAWRPTKHQWLKAMSCVQPEEKQRIQNFVFKKDAKLSLIGRVLLRKALTELLNIPYQEIKLKRTDKGKPFLSNQIEDPTLNDFNFNVSHQGHYVVLAAESYRQVGIDVMKTSYPGGTDVPGFFHIMRKQFTPFEWGTVKKALSEWDQLQTFYRHWCLKESYVKAVGVGIGHDLQAIEFRLNTPNLSKEVVTCSSCLHLHGKERTDWKFEETMLDDLHQVAVALGPCVTEDIAPSPTRRTSPTGFQILTFDDVISSAISLQPLNDEDWVTFQAKRDAQAR